jgi:hypothetical protein
VELSKDALSSRVVHESRVQIDKLARDIRERLGELEAWNRESWKAEVRAKVLPRVPSRDARTAEERSAKSLAIRKAFEVVFPDGTWHPPFIQEILAEDDPAGSVERREKLLSFLAVPHAVAVKPDDAPRRRIDLLKAVRDLCRAAGEIEFCEGVLAENEHAVEKDRLGVLERIRRWLRKSLGRLDDRAYEIEYRPSPGAQAKGETISFLRFISEMQELRTVLADMTKPGSPGYRRVEAMDEEELCDFLDWQLRQLRPLHRRMEGLNAFFQIRAVEAHAAVKSIKLELLAIENGMIRADAVRRDSISCREKQKPSP